MRERFDKGGDKGGEGVGFGLPRLVGLHRNHICK